MATKKNDRFPKFKPKFIKGLAERNNEADIREDEEQSEKLQEIIDLLVAAGYFRARIKNLSPFDKVVGGMTWCIEFCNIEVDVDLLFQENSTIGQKIALTEKIVAVLPQIHCPHPIEPHQIQGLDFIHIFPVIQWLLKRSMEYRKDVSKFCYSYALNQFEKNFYPNHGLTDKQQQLLHNIKMVNEVYKPHRVFKKKSIVPYKDLNSKVQITLLEYGYRSDISQTRDNIEENPNFQEDVINHMMDNLGQITQDTSDYDEIAEEDREKISEHYNNLKKDFENATSPSGEENQVSNLMEKKEDITKNLKKSLLNQSKIKESIEKIKESIREIKLEQCNINEAIKSLATDENNSEKSNAVEELLLHGDNLEKQRQEFEEHCKKESHSLTTSIEKIETKSASADSKCEELDHRIEDEHEKLKVLRLQVAKKNRAISTLQRRIDEIPSRPELSQYQKRFIELYNQISAKHKETKQYYSLYNTLEDTRQYMKKELSLLNSVIDNYPEAMRSKEGKEEFLQQFSNILEGIKQSKLKLEQRLLQEKKKRDEMSDSLHGYIELNRKYANAIKELKMEFQKNEEIIKNIM
ncbi:coiled-coil domain-containing protein 93 [Harmonia axyridis]|uniref:coiled-coil domain-containing protein 93 n=1 Tax=Harmonia axyridis TaxID=115357 RepID=UPI001E279CCC|nr:coiled-coil domain-containing protein 93 [Harmonia axyridis]